MKSSNLVFILTIISMCTICLAQSSPKDFLDAHNEYRKRIGAKPLILNETLISYAQKHADSLKKTCETKYSMGPYGENMVYSYGDLNAKDSMRKWLSENLLYDHNHNRCVSDKCLHYTKVIWNDTKSLGCARSKCDNGGTVVVCEYYPIGKYKTSLPS